MAGALLLLIACELGGLIIYIAVRDFVRGLRYLKEGKDYEP